MAQQTIGIGAAANDGTGDDLRSAGAKINANFTELYGWGDHGAAGYLTSVDWTDLTGVPATFPPEAHGHAIIEIIGLQGVLDTKAATASLAAVALSGAYADLVGVPATFAPSAHTHTLSEITDAAAALDARDTANRARSNHTGTQAASTISDFAAASDARIAASDKVSSDPTGVTGALAITNMIRLSQAQYDAISTPDAATFYVITG